MPQTILTTAFATPTANSGPRRIFYLAGASTDCVVLIEAGETGGSTDPVTVCALYGPSFRAEVNDSSSKLRYTLKQGSLLDVFMEADQASNNVVRKSFTRAKVVDGSAGAAIGETIVFRATEACTVDAVYFNPDATLASSDTTYATLRAWRRTAAGASQTAVASATTKTGGGGGTGDWTAFAPVALGTSLGIAMAAGQVLTVDGTKASTGVAVPAGVWQADVTIP